MLGTCLKTMMGHVGEVTSIIELTQSNKVFSGSTQGQQHDPNQIDRCFLLCTTGEDATVRIWSPVGINGRMISVLRGHTNNVMCVIELLHPTTYPVPPSTARSSINTNKSKRSGIPREDSRRGSHGSQSSLNSLGSLTRRSELSGLGGSLGVEIGLKGSGSGGVGGGVGGSESMSTGRRLSQSTMGELDQNQQFQDHHDEQDQDPHPAEESEIEVHDGEATSNLSVRDNNGIGMSGANTGRSSVSRRSVHVQMRLDNHVTEDRHQEDESQHQQQHHPISDRSNNNNNNNNRNQTNITYSDELSLSLAQIDNDDKRALICSGSYDRTLRIWHWSTGRCLRVIRVGKNIHAIAQLHNGRISVAGDDNIITIWNWITGVCDMSLEGHANYVRSLVQLADGRLCSGSMDNTLKLWK